MTVLTLAKPMQFCEKSAKPCIDPESAMTRVVPSCAKCGKPILAGWDYRFLNPQQLEQAYDHAWDNLRVELPKDVWDFFNVNTAMRNTLKHIVRNRVQSNRWILREDGFVLYQSGGTFG